ncbi:MAG TPA: tetratricopeptide repeat protein [Pyrinomonadaceae bacterium]|nr:tetratricopeptide repeat protein [Pyrinomonadaceae bacterium]
MSTKVFLLSIVAVVLAFIGGFLLANSINRSELNTLRSELESARNTAKRPMGDDPHSDLSPEEIQAKIDEANANPDNFNYQKNLGLALAQYGSAKQDVALITQAARLLDRASTLAPDDIDVTIGEGNAAFDIGYFNKDNASLQKARDYYEKALSKRPDDAGVRTEMGMTYFAEDPPQDDKAVAEFKKALARDPKQVKALEFIIQALLRQQNRGEAEKYLAELREANPSDEALPDLTKQLKTPQK